MLRANLRDVLRGTPFSADDVLALVEERCGHSYVELSAAVRSGADVRAVVEPALGVPASRVCFLPTTSWVEENAHALVDAFESVVLCDTIKAGREVAGRTIVAPDDVATDDFDAFVVTTATRSVADELTAPLPRARVVGFDALAAGLVDRAGVRARAHEVLARVRAAERPLVVLTGIYLHGYTPTLAALAAEGFDVFVVARSATAFRHTGHVDDLRSAVRFGELALLDADDFERLAEELDCGVVLVPGAEETFLGVAFDQRRAAASYAWVAALARTLPVPVALGLYDVVKPTVHGLEAEDVALATYARMLEAADLVLLGANTADAGELATRMLDVSTPVRSFYRRPPAAPLQPTLTDGVHLVMVGGSLFGDSPNPFWVERDELARILRQGVHLHAYSSSETTRRFERELTEAERAFFHVHPSIADPRELVTELSRYHAGLILNDTARLADMIAAHRTREWRELLWSFLQTVASSASMLFGAAGIPTFLNRICADVRREFPPECFLPLEVSELPRLGDTVRALDWNRVHAATRAARGRFTIESAIDELTELLTELESSTREVSRGA